MCSLFEAALARLDRGGYVDGQMLSGMVHFFEQFVEHSHQVKEEQVLFPMLAATSEPGRALTERLTIEHAAQRARLGELAVMFDPSSRHAPLTRASFAVAARRYVALLRAHVRIENERFPELCVAALAPPRGEGLCRQFEEIERLGIGPTGREWYTQVIADYRDIVATWDTDFDRSPRRSPG